MADPTAWAAMAVPAAATPTAPDHVGGGFHAEAVHVGQRFVEGSHAVKEIQLRASDARVAGLDGEANAAVPFDDGAGGEGVRPLAAHLIQAEAFPRVLIVKPR